MVDANEQTKLYIQDLKYGMNFTEKSSPAATRGLLQNEDANFQNRTSHYKHMSVTF